MNRVDVYTYRPSHGYDCTNNGASSRHERMTLFVGEIDDVLNYIRRNEIDPDGCLFLIKRELWGENADYLVPITAYDTERQYWRWSIAGGNYAYTCDSRWRVYTGSRLPLPIHDRVE